MTGIGVGNFGRAEGSIAGSVAEFDADGERLKWSAAHNSFIQIGAEVGLPALILWSSLVFGGVIGMRRMHRRIPRFWARGDSEQRFLYAATLYLPVALIGFFATASFVSFAYQDPIYVLAAFLGGVYVSVNARLRREAQLRRYDRDVGGQESGSRPEAYIGATVRAGVGP